MRKIGIFVMAILLATMTFAEQGGLVSYNAEDAAPALRIRYLGSDSTVTISNTAAGVFYLVDGSTVTNTITTTNTMAYTVNALVAATNSAGKKNFDVEYFGSLSTDSLSNKFIAAANVSLADRAWHNIGKIDTSGSLTFDAAYANDAKSGTYLQKAYGSPGGTGNVTIEVFVDGVEKFQKIVVSPTYYNGSNASQTNNSVTNIANDVVWIEEDFGLLDGTPGIFIGNNQRVHVRFTRATTATTGGAGCITMIK